MVVIALVTANWMLIVAGLVLGWAGADLPLQLITNLQLTLGRQQPAAAWPRSAPGLLITRTQTTPRHHCTVCYVTWGVYGDVKSSEESRNCVDIIERDIHQADQHEINQDALGKVSSSNVMWWWDIKLYINSPPTTPISANRLHDLWSLLRQVPTVQWF